MPPLVRMPVRGAGVGAGANESCDERERERERERARARRRERERARERAREREDGRASERASDRTANWTQTLQNGRPTWDQIVRLVALAVHFQNSLYIEHTRMGQGVLPSAELHLPLLPEARGQDAKITQLSDNSF